VFASNPIVAKGAAEALVKHKTNKTGVDEPSQQATPRSATPDTLKNRAAN
jgi:hypothetical protein